MSSLLHPSSHSQLVAFISELHHTCMDSNSQLKAVHILAPYNAHPAIFACHLSQLSSVQCIVSIINSLPIARHLLSPYLSQPGLLSSQIATSELLSTSANHLWLFAQCPTYLSSLLCFSSHSKNLATGHQKNLSSYL